MIAALGPFRRSPCHRCARAWVLVSCIQALAPRIGAQPRATDAALPAPPSGANAAPAEAVAPSPVPVVVAPRLLGDAIVEYPAGASGAHEVVLELVVGATGEVLDAQAVQGDEPFAGEAARAARGFRFEPARRGDTAVAAKIRFLVRFPDPAAQLPDEPPAAPPLAPPVAGLPERPVEVTVEGERVEPLAQTLTRAEVRQLPGAFGDPFRAIEALPGVTPILSGVPFFYVRGAPPGNVGYFLDGIRLPLLYHVGLGPSVVHPGMVARVDLYPGAYPTRYGRFSGGIVAGEVTEPADAWRGEWQLRLFDAGAMVEAPLFDGRGHVLVGGRYSYTAYLISLLGEDARLEYWDYQLRAGYRLSESDSLSAFVFGSFDYFGEDTSANDDNLFSTEFHRIDLRHKHQFSQTAELESAVTVGMDRTRIEEDSGSALNRRVQLRSAYDERLTPELRLRAGADGAIDFYEIETDVEDSEPPVFEAAPGTVDPTGAPIAPPPMPPELMLPEEATPDDTPTDGEADVRRLFPSRRDVAAGVYADLTWDATRDTRIVPGLRLDAYASDGAVALSLEPRLSAEFRVSQRLTLKNAIGLAAQPPSFVVPVAGFEIGGLPGGLQRSVQSSAGAEYRLPDAMKLSLTLFHNAFFNMTDVLSLLRVNEGEDLSLDSRTRGQAYGLEFMFHRDLTRRLGGFLSYTLSRSVRSTSFGQLPASFDRTHVLNAVLAYDLGRRWRAGGRFVFYTGNPGFTLEDPTDTRRLPPFHRLDVRIEKRWPIGSAGAYWAFVLEVLNTTLSTEVLTRECDGGICEDEVIGPITIPSLAFEGRF